MTKDIPFAAAAHGDHDALAELRAWIPDHSSPDRNGDDVWWVDSRDIEDKIDELRARPRAVPDAPAHADHDALASFQQWLMQVEALDVRHDLGLQPKELGDGIRSALVHVRLEVDRRLARPRAVPDAGALLRELGDSSVG